MSHVFRLKKTNKKNKIWFALMWVNEYVACASFQLTVEKSTQTEELLLQAVVRNVFINILKDIAVPSVGYDHGWVSDAVTRA